MEVMEVKNKVRKTLKCFSLGMAISTFLASCSGMMNEPVRDFFKEYTETAVVEKAEINSSNRLGLKTGVSTLYSEKDGSVTFILRNPQKYKLNVSYEFDQTPGNLSGFSIKQDSSDLNVIKLLMSQSFLEGVDINSKNLSGKVVMVEQKSQRTFENYPFSLQVDSNPPAVENACFQLSSSSNGKYIICFYIPDVKVMPLHKKDTRKIYFNGALRYFNEGVIYKTATFNSGAWTFSDQDANFQITAPSGMTVSESGYDFTTSDKPENFTAVYYLTGIRQSPVDVPMEIKIEDDAGFSSKVEISNKAEELSAPFITGINDLYNGVFVSSETGLREIVIKHNGKAESGKACGNVNLSFKVYDYSNPANPVLVKSGSGVNVANVNLTRGKYKITAKASKPYYIDSAEYNTAEDPSKVVILNSPAVFYVSNTGSNVTGNGSKASPFRSIQKAIDVFDEGVTASVYDSTTLCNIKILSDLTPDSTYDDFGPACNNSLVDLKNTNEYLIEGAGGKFAVDAKKKGRVIDDSLTGSSTNLVIKNLVIKGGRLSGKGVAVYSKRKLILENCTVTENKCIGNAVDGGIIYCERAAALNNCAISNNNELFDTATGSGLLLYAAYGYGLTNCTVSGNDVSVGAGGGTAIYGVLFSNGGSYSSTITGSKITNNTLDSETAPGINIKGFVTFADNMAASLMIENTVITGNSAKLGTGSKLYGTVFAGSSRQTSIKGNNTIYNNHYTFDGVTKKQCNVYVNSSKPLVVSGKINGKVGITTDTAPASTIDRIVYTAGYGYGSSNVQMPANVFASDEDYAVTVSGNEAALAVSGGAIGDVLSNQEISFECAEYAASTATPKTIKFYPGISKTISISPTLKVYDVEVPAADAMWNNVSWSTWIEMDGEVISGTRKNGTGKDMKAVIPETVIYEDNYFVCVKATLNRASYNASWPVKGGKDISFMYTAPTVGGTYFIKSVEGLKKLKEWVEAGKVSTTDYVFELTDDISNATDVGNIGTTGSRFKAVLDGKGHEISGLNITGNGTDCCGLFSYMNGGVIRNLTIAGTINCNSADSSTRIGGFAGTAIGSRFINCRNKTSITSSNGGAAGIVGSVSTSCLIDGCINEGSVQANGFVGGIVAAATGNAAALIVRNCGNVGDVTSTKNSSYAGGIEPKQSTSIYNCYNLGEVTANNGNAGGIVAQWSGSYALANCYSHAVIAGGTGKMGNISGNRIDGAASCNNYFRVPEATTCLYGAADQTLAPYTYESTIAGGRVIADSAANITVGAYGGKDVERLLNAWITNIGPDGAVYKHWVVESEDLVLSE